MIVDTMTFEEITEYLLKNCFPKDRVQSLYMSMLKSKGKKYRREILNWHRNPFHDQYKIFPPEVAKECYGQELVIVPFASGRDYIDFVIFTQFQYRNRKYVAMKLVDNTVWYFSWHTLERYAERCLGDKDAEIDREFIGDMLLYNCGAMKTEYEYQGKKTVMLVSTDGGFLSHLGKNYTISHTFISPQEYFNTQSKLDIRAFEALKRHKKEAYGFWLQRG